MALILLGVDGRARAGNCSAGHYLQNGCGDIPYEGCCLYDPVKFPAGVVVWCDPGDILCFIDCTMLPSCGWDNAGSLYNCDTAGGADPSGVYGVNCNDLDSDGVEVPEDCDDSDPSVNPYAPENCNDGLDNDCDGYTDHNDSDCGSADDDASDDDASDDDASDDDASGDDDDDDDGDDDDEDGVYNENPGLGVMCGCAHEGSSAHASVAALAAIAALLVFRRRS